MKSIIVYTLFYAGDLVSRSFLFRFGWGYTLYNTLMTKSSDLQEKWNLNKPWTKVNN